MLVATSSIWALVRLSCRVARRCARRGRPCRSRRGRSRSGSRRRSSGASPRCRWRRAWRRARRASRGSSSGVSPGTTTTVESSSRSSPGNAVMPIAAASPVPRWCGCSTNTTFAHGGCEVLHLLGDLLGAVPDDERGAGRLQPLEGGDHVHHHRPAAHHVQRLRPRRTHPGALAGGEDDRGDRHESLTSCSVGRGPGGRAVWRAIAPGRGIEPLFTEPKSGVLPIERPRNRSSRCCCADVVSPYRAGAGIDR